MSLVQTEVGQLSLALSLLLEKRRKLNVLSASFIYV